ncbi:MAG TPA: membrane dipeptidase [Patescibacteria group bacterium]|nr:membrane dipeptidase [Patescibacteria group bacterium]
MARSYLELSKDEAEHAMALHEESVVIDSSVVAVIDYVAENMWLDDVTKGGLTATNLTVCMGRDFTRALKQLIEHDEWAHRNGERVLLVRKAEDIERAKREGKHGIIYGPQDSMFIERDVNLLKVAHDHGLRIMQLTYNWQNEVGAGCREEKDAGLSLFGERVVERMNELGILIDLSHTGDQTCWDAIEQSRDPVSFTHIIPRRSAPKEMGGYAAWATRSTNLWGDFYKYSQQRGKPDEMMQACAEKGGVIGITPFFAKKVGDSTITDDTLDQLDETVDIVGVDHTGFGSDLEFPNSITRGCFIWKNPDRIDVDYFTPMDKTWGYGWLEHMPNLTKGLVARGYSDQEIKKMLGHNWVKLFKRVWGG